MTKQEYYDHLCSIGMPDLIAASIANQSSSGVRKDVTNSMMDEIYAFCLWSDTKEGFAFWSCVSDCLK